MVPSLPVRSLRLTTLAVLACLCVLPLAQAQAIPPAPVPLDAGGICSAAAPLPNVTASACQHLVALMATFLHGPSAPNAAGGGQGPPCRVETIDPGVSTAAAAVVCAGTQLAATVEFIVIYYPPGVYQVVCFATNFCPCPQCPPGPASTAASASHNGTAASPQSTAAPGGSGSCSRSSGDIAVQDQVLNGNTYNCSSCTGSIVVQVGLDNRVNCANGCTGSIVVQVGSGALLQCGAAALLALMPPANSAPAILVMCYPGADPLHCGGIGNIACSKMPVYCPATPCPINPPDNYYCALLNFILWGTRAAPTAPSVGNQTASGAMWPGPPFLRCTGFPPGNVGALLSVVCRTVDGQLETVWILVVYYPPGAYQAVCFVTGFCPTGNLNTGQGSGAHNGTVPP